MGGWKIFNFPSYVFGWKGGKLFCLVGEKALAKCLFLDCKMGFWCLGILMFDVYSTLNVTGDCGWAWSSG